MKIKRKKKKLSEEVFRMRGVMRGHRKKNRWSAARGIEFNINMNYTNNTPNKMKRNDKIILNVKLN